MNTFRKLVCLSVVTALAASTPASASSSVILALPEMGTVAAQVAGLLSRELQMCVAKVVSASRATLKTRSPSVTVDDTHMIIEAKRLSPESEPFRGLSGPRKKQTRA
jgi:hypothetical protein